MVSDNREMINACFNRLLKELGPEYGGTAIQIILAELGGFGIHVPRRQTLEGEIRDERIRREFNGANHAELAFTYGLTPRRIREIVSRKTNERR